MEENSPPYAYRHHPEASPLHIPTPSLPACIACTLREGPAGVVNDVEEFVVVVAGSRLDEPGAGAEESFDFVSVIIVGTAVCARMYMLDPFEVAYHGPSTAAMNTGSTSKSQPKTISRRRLLSNII